MFLGASDTVALNFFGHHLPRARRKSVSREKLRPVRHGKQSRDSPAARRVHRRFHQAVPDVETMAARIGCDRERADFGEVGAIRLECDAAKKPFFFIPFFHDHEKMADVLADFVLGAREQRTLAGVMRDHAMHGNRIGGACDAGPHGFTPRVAKRSFAAAMASRTRPGAVPPSTSGPASAASRFSASKKSGANSGEYFRNVSRGSAENGFPVRSPSRTIWPIISCAWRNGAPLRTR